MTFSLKNDIHVPNPDPCHWLTDPDPGGPKRPVLRIHNTGTSIKSGCLALGLSKPSVRMLVQKYLFCYVFFSTGTSSVLTIIVLTWLNPDPKNSFCACASNGYTFAYVVSVPASAAVMEPYLQCCGSMAFWRGSGPGSAWLMNQDSIRILLFSSLTFKTPTKN